MKNYNFAISKCFNEILESGMNSSNQASFLTNCLQGLDSELKLKTSFTTYSIFHFFHIPEMIQQRTLTKAEYTVPSTNIGTLDKYEQRRL